MRKPQADHLDIPLALANGRAASVLSEEVTISQSSSVIPSFPVNPDVFRGGLDDRHEPSRPGSGIKARKRPRFRLAQYFSIAAQAYARALSVPYLVSFGQNPGQFFASSGRQSFKPPDNHATAATPSPMIVAK
jgi:hypothetical protein